MNNQEIVARLRALNLADLIPEIENHDLPYPMTRKRILRLLEIASTKFVAESVEIMKLHREIADDEDNR